MARKREVPQTPQFWMNLLCLLANYRIKKRITQVMRLTDGDYYVCPGCKVALEREFQNYCDRCGQHLDWTGYRKAAAVET